MSCGEIFFITGWRIFLFYKEKYVCTDLVLARLFRAAPVENVDFIIIFIIHVYIIKIL